MLNGGGEDGRKYLSFSWKLVVEMSCDKTGSTFPMTTWSNQTLLPWKTFHFDECLLLCAWQHEWSGASQLLSRRSPLCHTFIGSSNRKWKASLQLSSTSSSTSRQLCIKSRVAALPFIFITHHLSFSSTSLHGIPRPFGPTYRQHRISPESLFTTGYNG